CEFALTSPPEQVCEHSKVRRFERRRGNGGFENASCVIELGACFVCTGEFPRRHSPARTNDECASQRANLGFAISLKAMHQGKIGPRCRNKREALSAFIRLGPRLIEAPHVDQLPDECSPRMPQIRSRGVRFAHRGKHIFVIEKRRKRCAKGEHPVSENDLANELAADELSRSSFLFQSWAG